MATAAVRTAADFTVDAAGDLSNSIQDAGRTASHQVQNTVTRIRDDAEPDDMVQIQQADTEQRHPMRQLFEDKHMVKEPTRWGVANHDVSFSGLGGAMFLMMLFASVLFMASFASVGWVTEPDEDGESGETYWFNKGLWEECECVPNKNKQQDGYFTATQVLVTMGFIISWFAMVCITLYMCLCLNVIRKTYLLFGLMTTSALTVLLYFIALIIFGVGESRRLGWSYGLSMVASFLCGLAGCFAFLQLRRSLH